jgi:hypothetical protein
MVRVEQSIGLDSSLKMINNFENIPVNLVILFSLKFNALISLDSFFKIVINWFKFDKELKMVTFQNFGNFGDIGEKLFLNFNEPINVDERSPTFSNCIFHCCAMRIGFILETGISCKELFFCSFQLITSVSF